MRGFQLAVLLTSAALAGPAIAQPTLEEAPAQAVAAAYGIEHWPQIEEIHFTFNVARGEDVMSRQWTWRPHENQVTLQRAGEEPITYRRDELSADSPAEVVQADRQFINDSYWFLFPFQPVWSNPTTTYRGEAPLPIGEGSARKVTVQYPAAGGYTPGDAYDLYLGEDGRILQWVFRRGGGENGRAVAWKRHARLGPIVVSLERVGPQGQRQLWFSDVSAQVRGESAPVAPELLEE